MSELPQKDNLDDVSVEPLSDEALEDVAGGLAADSSSGTCCSCSSCSSAPSPTPAPSDPIIVA